MAKTTDAVPPHSVGWWDFVQATDPAVNPANLVGPGKQWVETDDDSAPTQVVAVHVRNMDNSAWLPYPMGAASSGGDAQTLDGFDSPYFATAANLALKIAATEKAAANGVATLDAGGKVPSAQIPAIALVKPTVVANLAARLALTAQAGDVAVQTDTSISYMLKEAGDPTVDADWIELKAPTGAAPSGASYLTYGSEASLSAERVLTDSTDVTGDTSVAGVFKLFLANLAVATAKIAERAVTWAKVQAISTGVLLGRTTASAGDVEEITPSARFSLAAGALDLTNAMRDVTVPFVIDGGGAVITTGLKGFVEIPFAGTIVSVRLLADQSGSIVVDLWKDTYANYPPTVADTITAAAKPTITAATKSQDTTLTGWTTSVTVGDILGFNVDSATTVQRVTCSLVIRRS